MADEMTRLLEWLPRGNTLDEASFRRRHLLLQWVLAAHIPVILALGWGLGDPMGLLLAVGVGPIVLFLALGHFIPQRRAAASLISAGLVWCSIALVGETGGTIEAHFHFFIIIGFIALYQDWVPFLWNVVFTGVSHGIGTIFWPRLIFNHPAAQENPWVWSGIHAGAVLLACVGMVIFWRITEDEQSEKEELGRELVRADAEIGRRQFTSDMLINLARRNQSMLYRQLDIINQLEEKEQDPDALAELFKLDHLATRVRRNAESLLVLSGEQPPRVWSAPVSMRDVVRAAIAETEDLDRVEFSVDDRTAVAGHSVADLTHLLAELTENAVRFSPPDTSVTIRSRPQRPEIGGQVLTIEDWGVGMPADELAAANEMLIRPREVDLSVSQRLGFHVVARLAQRHRIEVSLSTTPGSGLTAVVILPAVLFVTDPQAGPHAGIGAGPEQTRRAAAVHEYAAGNGHSNGNGNGHSNGNGYSNGNGHAPVPVGVGTVDLPGLSGHVAPAGATAPPVWTAPTPRSRRAPGTDQNPLSFIGDVNGSNGNGGTAGNGDANGVPRGNWSGWWDPEPAGRPAEAGAWGGPRPSPSAMDNGNGNGNGNNANGNGNGSNGHGTHGRATGPNGHGTHPGRSVDTLRVADTSPAPQPAPAVDDAGHAAGVSVPSPRPAEVEAEPAPQAPAAEQAPVTGSSGLRRRVPQASLAPELRVGASTPQARPGPAPAGPATSSVDAAQALSRYQASRQAAQAVAEQQVELEDRTTDRRTTP